MWCIRVGTVDAVVGMTVGKELGCWLRGTPVVGKFDGVAVGAEVVGSEVAGGEAVGNIVVGAEVVGTAEGAERKRQTPMWPGSNFFVAKKLMHALSKLITMANPALHREDSKMQMKCSWLQNN